MGWIVHVPGTRESGTRCAEHGRYCRYKAAYRAPDRRIHYHLRGCSYHQGDCRGGAFKRKRDAEHWFNDQEGDGRHDRLVDEHAGRVTVTEFWSYFTDTNDVGPSTRALYDTHARLYILPAFGDRRLGSINQEDVTRFLSGLKRPDGKPAGAATRAAVYRLLHRVMGKAVREGRIVRNPADIERAPKVQQREPRFLTDDEIRMIADEVPERHRALVWTLAVSGLRIGEASALRVKNLLLREGVIRVAENSPEVGGVKIAGTTKTKRSRSVDIPPALVRMLKDHLATFGAPLDPESYVFTSDEGDQVRQNNFRKRVFQPAAHRAGIMPTPTVHDLRHTAASLMAKAGYSQLEAAQQLGHSSLSMTERYSHVFKEHRQAKVAALDSVLESRS